MNHHHRLDKSFGFAWKGIVNGLRTQRNMRIQLASSILVIFAGFWFNISAIEWMIVMLCIGLVVSAELFNTALEYLADFVSPEWETRIGDLKDMAAAAVLVLGIFSTITGMIIFVPKIMKMYF